MMSNAPLGPRSRKAAHLPGSTWSQCVNPVSNCLRKESATRIPTPALAVVLGDQKAVTDDGNLSARPAPRVACASVRTTKSRLRSNRKAYSIFAVCLTALRANKACAFHVHPRKSPRKGACSVGVADALGGWPNRDELESGVLRAGVSGGGGEGRGRLSCGAGRAGGSGTSGGNG